MNYRCFALRCILVFTAAQASHGLAQEKAGSLPTLEFRKWSGTINVPDPVALALDDQGRVYVTQTRRRKIQDLDIRQHREWIPNDLGLRSVADKSQFFKTQLAIGGDQSVQRKHVEDVNGDGVHDWRDLTVISEVIYRLEDEDGDGTADSISTFSEDFRTEVTGIAAGVLEHEGDIYATVAPDLWKLKDDDSNGIADSKTSIAHGFGLHIAYAGHDMHGLTVGPDGKIYWSIGDKGINVTTADGSQFSYPDQGGVMRCNPDGSDFEVFAHGLRNVQEIAFDQFGNLFGVDNDSDQPGEKERFVYIVDQMDAGWRCYYQYRENKYNPWTAERLWELPSENHPAYIIPPLSHFIDGPAGFKFNPGTALSPEFKDYFFLTGAPAGGQFAFQIKRNGDTFEMVNNQQIGSGLAIVGLAFGPDGALYGADWDGGYPLDEKGSVIKIDVPVSMQTDTRSEVAEILRTGLAEALPSDLVRLLNHADMRVRLKAQFQLVKLDRGDLLAAELQNGSAQLAKLHAIWGLGQLARNEDTLARDSLVLAFRDSDPMVRGQAVKTYGELRKVNATPILKLVKDEDPYVKTLASLALARQPAKSATETLLEQAAALKPNQYYLRHGLVSALASCAAAENLASASENETQQLVATLALRRMAHPAVQQFLDHPNRQIADAAARAIHDDDSIAQALPSLAASLAKEAKRSDAFLRRSINANYRLGTQDCADRLRDFCLSSAQPELRSEALDCLANWEQPALLDRVEGIYRPISTSRAPIRFDRYLNDFLSSNELSTRRLAIESALNTGKNLPIATLVRLIEDQELPGSVRVTALRSLDKSYQQLIEEALKSEDDELRIAALEIASQDAGQDRISDLMDVIQSAHSLAEKQASIRILAAQKSEPASAALLQLATELREGALPADLANDVYVALQNKDGEDFAKLRKEIDANAKPPLTGELAKFSFLFSGGIAKNGKQLFKNHIQAQCSRCHRVGDQGSNIGPELTQIGSKRNAQQLLNSIVLPSHEIEEKYRTQLILLESGQVLKGAIQSESDEVLELADANGKIQKILADEIESIKQQDVSLMPSMAEILTPSEIRDLVAYLSSLKQDPNGN